MATRAGTRGSAFGDVTAPMSLKEKFGVAPQGVIDEAISRKPVPMQLSGDDATRRLVVSAAKRVIRLHEKELKALAYK